MVVVELSSVWEGDILYILDAMMGAIKLPTKSKSGCVGVDSNYVRLPHWDRGVYVTLTLG